MERVEVITEEEYKELKSHVKENESPRNYLLAVLKYNLPLQISKLLQLKVSNVRTNDGKVKNELLLENQENLKFNKEASRALQFYFDQVEAKQTDWLFPSKSHDKAINRSWVWKLVNRWVKGIGLEGKYGTGSLRKKAGITSGRGSHGYYNIDIDTFDNINNERAAYALGLIATDGTIVPEVYKLQFEVTDKELVENLEGCLKSDKEIRTKTIEGQKQLYCYSTCQKKVVEDILKYVPAKSKEWTEISTQLKESSAIHHFVRGVLDGDGHVGRGKEYGENNVIITGGQGVLNDLQDITVVGCGVERIYIRKKSESEEVYGEGEYYDLKIVGRDQVRLLYEWIYDDAQYCLTRKKKAMENIIAGDTNTSEYMDELWDG